MRKIFTLLAWVVDANGTYNILSGFPKAFDSRNYNNDADKALLRARGEFHDTIGDMCRVDSRKVQSIVLMDEGGMMLDNFSAGSLYEPEEDD